jgi:hypothetical protein
MYKFTMCAAGRVAAVSTRYPGTLRHCRDYLCDGEPDFSITVTPEDIAFEREKNRRECILEGIPETISHDGYLEALSVQRKLTERLFEWDTLLFHGSVVAVDGQAYLFTAVSGTGKSTHTALWRQLFGDRAVMVNDDKPFLQITEEGVIAWGSPWMGKHRLGANIHLPLKAICLLERGEENRIQQVPPQTMLPILLQQSSRPRDPRNMPRYLELVDRMARNTAFYRLSCNMDIQAAQVAYDAMSGTGENV